MRLYKKWTNTGKGRNNKNMNSLPLIEKYLNEPQSSDDLALAVAQALERQKPSAQWILLKYQPASHPFAVLFSNSKKMPKADELVPAAFKNWASFYLDDVTSSGVAYLLVCSSPFDDQSNTILQTWRSLQHIIDSYSKSIGYEQQTNFGNQYSQLLHDVESLIAIFKNPEADQEAINERIQYQKRLNNRLLFYNRELELLKTKVPIGNLINACLQKQNLDAQRLSVHYIDLLPELQVEVDVELFDQALGEILNNALIATENDQQKINIEIRKKTDAFHLILKKWLIVSIIDKGTGINPDYLSWATLPYFTTWKAQGHSGFGLSIAQKIIKAHQGFLEINSAQGSRTVVNLFLPGFNNNAEE